MIRLLTLFLFSSVCAHAYLESLGNALGPWDDKPPRGRLCGYTGICPAGQHCVGLAGGHSICVPNGVYKCTSNDQCLTWQTCDLNRRICVKKSHIRALISMSEEGKKCHIDGDCDPGQRCKANEPTPWNMGTCVASRKFTGCVTNAQCPPHQFCSHTLHVCLEKTHESRRLTDLSKCHLDSECSGDQICVPTDLLPLAPGVCAPKNHGGLCTSDSECKGSQKCSGTDDKWGLCLVPTTRHLAPTSRGHCTANRHCPPKFYCSKYHGIGICKRIQVHPGTGGRPTRRPRPFFPLLGGDCPKVECPRGFECRNGLCRQMYPSFD